MASVACSMLRVIICQNSFVWLELSASIRTDFCRMALFEAVALQSLGLCELLKSNDTINTCCEEFEASYWSSYYKRCGHIFCNDAEKMMKKKLFLSRLNRSNKSKNPTMDCWIGKRILRFFPIQINPGSLGTWYIKEPKKEKHFRLRSFDVPCSEWFWIKLQCI